MLQCPKDTFLRLFYNVSASLLLLLIFFHFTFIFLAKLFIFFGGNPFHQRNQDGYEFDASSDEGMEEEDAEEERSINYGPQSVGEGNRCVANIIHDRDRVTIRNSSYEPPRVRDEESSERSLDDNEEISEKDEAVEEEEEEEILAGDTNPEANENDPTSNLIRRTSLGPNNYEAFPEQQPKIISISHGKKLLVQEKEDNEIYGDTFTTGSTSRDSSEWRSSINCTEDPFSSSSRRSCPKWESYTLFQKYDEEMLFLDRISVQKLHETESMRSTEARPGSISERIVYKFKPRSQKSSEFQGNPYYELESAYVAQICLTWEALNWNYNYIKCLRASRREFDPGCPAYVAQQFQQFQVLLQRYVESEPYEHGRRPEIYARTRGLTPKLLQVPEYRDSDDDKREEGLISSRIPSSSFIGIMEESIRTFMNFLKQDKKNKYQILVDFFKRPNRRGSAEATLPFLLKKVNKKKKAELNAVGRSGKCLRKRKLKEDEELEILMALIDLKVVSRVLRMAALNGEQMDWCENKMSKVRVSDGKLHRDSSPLFFPAH